MKLLFSCIGRRSYMVDFFRESLGPDDVIIGTSNTKLAAGLRYCDKNYLMPGITDPKYIPTMVQLCKDEGIDVLLSFLDQDVDILAQSAHLFHEIGVQTVLPPPKASTICFDKYETFKFLKENGFNTPLTFIDMDEAKAALESGEISYPVIVKPKHGFGSRHIYKASNWQEVEVFSKMDSGMMVQEMIHGEELDMDIFNDLKGEEVLAVVPWKKFSSRGGETDLSVTLENAEMMELGKKLGKAVGQAGPMDVDVFHANDKYYILELNPRFGGGYPLTHLAGGDYPGMILKLAKGEKVAPRFGDYKVGTVMVKEFKISSGEITNISDEYLLSKQD